ncbi:hypothetical protein C8Q76DRAFT_782822, partial [Earliella scabrosa]
MGPRTSPLSTVRSMLWLEIICLQSMETHTYTPGPTGPYSNNPAAARTARNMSESQITRIIAVVAAGQIDWYIRSAATALLAYEYMVAFDREVDLFWKRKLTMATVLFIANRYVPLAATIMNLPYSVTIQSCGPVSYTLNVVRIAQYLPWAVFSAARVFVLSSRTWFIALGVFLLSMSPVIIDCVTLAYLNVISNGIECGAVIKLSISSQHRFAILSRTCLIAADIVVLAITWNATFKMSRESRAVGQRASLSAIMFRDGVIYFLILLVTNILHLSFTLPSIATPVASNPASSIVVLSEPFTAILMSR